MSTSAQNYFRNISTTSLAAIFQYFCNNEPVHLPLQPSDPRYILSLVCRRWVNTVRSTCSLWDNVHFSKPGGNEAFEPYPLLHQFALCAVRSGQNPLSIVFNMICDGWTFSIVRSVIIPHIHRIKSLRCPIYGNGDIIKFMTIQEGPFSILESMEIYFVNTWDERVSSFIPEVSLRFNGLCSAPRLRNVTFRLLNNLRPIDLKLPWGQLTTLDMGTTAMEPKIFLKIMDSTSIQLEAGFFYVKFTRPPRAQHKLWKRPFIMHALQTLRVRLLFPSEDTRLFSLLRFPAPQLVWFEMHDQFQDWDLALYTKLLRASTKTLRILRLTDYPAPGTEPAQGIVAADSELVIRRRHRETTYRSLERLFQLTPNLEQLNLPLGVYIHAPTLEKMASCALLPQLYSLELGAVNGWHVLSMVRRRHAAHCYLAQSFAPGPSQQTMGYRLQPFGLRSVNVLIPRYGCSGDEQQALAAEARALRGLGIRCDVQNTDILPLPMMKTKTAVDAMQSHLRAPGQASGVHLNALGHAT
ncbi:hypothetical protein BJ912DRAFT_1139315 [Pholiota molesta]|nr:hypothetical protein BJ912DRAFT_1139315 [Pholiota molesta]